MAGERRRKPDRKLRRFFVLFILVVVITLSLVWKFSTRTEEFTWDKATLTQSLQREIQQLHHLAASENLIAAVQEQNSASYTVEQSMAADQVWLASDASHPLKQSVSTHSVSQLFSSLLKSQPHFNELMLIDRTGNLVAASPLTSDYWQGDELKWQSIVEQSLPFFVSAKTFDQSSGVNSVQLSVPVKEGERVVGVLVVGIRLSYVFRRQIESR